MARLLIGFVFLVSMVGQAKALTCEDINMAADAAVNAKYSGVRLIDALNAFKGSDYPLVKDLLMQAYSLPSYGSDKYIKKAKNEFVDKIYLQCLKGKFNKYL